MASSNDSGGCFVVSLALLAGIILFITQLVGGCMPEYAVGTKTGVVTRAAKRGFFFTSYEFEMNLGGVKSGNTGGMAGTWDFSSRDEETYNQLIQAMDIGEPIEVQFNQYWIKPLKVDTHYNVRRVISHADLLKKAESAKLKEAEKVHSEPLGP